MVCSFCEQLCCHYKWIFQYGGRLANRQLLVKQKKKLKYFFDLKYMNLPRTCELPDIFQAIENTISSFLMAILLCALFISVQFKDLN